MKMITQDPEISEVITRYSRRHVSNYIEQRHMIEEAEKTKDLETHTSPEIEEESINYESNEFQELEDFQINTTTRQKLDAYLNNGIFQTILSFISFFFALIIYIIYIVSTYFPLHNFYWYNILNIVLSSFHNLETLLYLYLADHRIIYILSYQTIFELFSSIYPYFCFFENNFNQKVLECARVFQIFRIRNYLKVHIRINENEVVKCLIDILILSISMILLFASLFRIVEISQVNSLIIHPNSRLYKFKTQTKFHEFLYFTVITISTVGYGDIYPISEGGRILIICLIISAAYYIPKKTGEILSMLEDTSIYSREIFKSHPEIPHLILCGSVSVEALVSFCEELFHDDHGPNEKNVIILDKNKPTPEMRIFLHAGKYEMNLKYLEGNPMNEKDLERADITKAKAIVILTDKYATNPHEIDHQNILLALYIKKFLLKKKIINSTIYLQLIKPENKIHYITGLESLSIDSKISEDRIIVVEEIKMNLLSKSCLLPGIIPLISNLVRSSGSSSETNYLWLNEYLDGIEQEIYRTELNESFKNKTFAQISKFIYKIFDSIAFALEIEIDGKTIINLNPGGFFIQKFLQNRDDVKFYIYVICSDKEVANQIAKADINKELIKDKDENEEKEENYFLGQKINKKDLIINKTKFQQYMKLRLKDMILLEENSYYNYDFRDEEDDYYFATSKKWASSDVKKISIRNSRKYRDHIVVCGTHPALYYYLLPLRSKNIGRKNLKYVVILTPYMSKNLWDSIVRFEKIILINGSPLNMEDLYRANIEYASKVVILENDSSNNNCFSDKMIDSERIFIYKAIKNCNPNIQIMTELIFESNIEYILPRYELSHLKPNNVVYNITSVFSSGEVYINSLIDTLTAQAYYNKHIVTIIHQLLTGGKKSGNSTIRKICEDVGLKSSNFWQTDIPEKFINKTFGKLYDEFCENNLVILGMYRLPGARDNNTGYIYTKPKAETIITHRDKVFVLASSSGLKSYFNEDINKNEIDDEGEDNNNMNNEFINEENFGENMENEIELNEDRKKYSPFNYIREQLYDIDKEIIRLNEYIDIMKASVKENISSAIRQEIISLLK